MCLGIPMQIKSIDGLVARCEARGVERELKLLFLQHETLNPGDFLVADRGNAIQKISPEAAAAAWAVYDEMLAAADAQAYAGGKVP
ncbi:MAG: HypC/HybG/HupF family hydrogenase formation chaperone [Pseudomonadota bacterium]